MKRTRRAVKASRGMIVPIPFTLFLALLAGAALFYLWLCGQCESLGGMLREVEQEQIALQRRFQNESFKWANLCAPESLEQALRRHGLTMGWPNRDQIIRLYDVRVDRSYSVVGMRGGVR